MPDFFDTASHSRCVSLRMWREDDPVAWRCAGPVGPKAWHEMTWETDALAMGWEQWRLDAFAKNVANQQGEVLLATENVLALRTGRGALQCTYRNNSMSCIARAHRDTNHLPEWIKPTD